MADITIAPILDATLASTAHIIYTDAATGTTKKAPISALPLSDAEVAALALKAPLASPTFTGNPTAPTQTAGNNSTRIATTEFVTAAIAAAPGGGGEVEEPFTDVILFDSPQKFSSTTQTADINFTLASSGNLPRCYYETEIYPDGVHDISIDTNDFHVYGATDPSQVNYIQFYNPANASIRPTATVRLEPTYGTLPAFTSFTLTMVDDDALSAVFSAISGATSYNVWYKKTSDPTFALHGTTTSTTYLVNNLDPVTSYDVYIVAEAFGMTSSQSATETETTDTASTAFTESLEFDAVGDTVGFADPSSDFDFRSGAADLPFSGGVWMKTASANYVPVMMKADSTSKMWAFG